MHLIAIGLNHKTTPLELRERLAVPQSALGQVAQALTAHDAISEAVVVSTCNRVECYLVAANCCIATQIVAACLAKRAGLEPASLQAHLYAHERDAALRHLFRVTASLDSMLIGEPQITGQVKQAYHAAVEAGAVDTLLHRCLHESFKVAKKVRVETGIGENAVSLSFLAVELARQIFGRLDDRRALLIGAGEMSALAARHLQQQGLRELLIANRSPDRAARLAEELGGASTHTLNALPSLLVNVDIVLASTNAPGYLLCREEMSRVMRARRGRTLFLIDLAVPRDIEPSIHKLDNAYLYDVDDLQHILQDNLAARQREATVAENLIIQEVRRFDRRLAQLGTVPTIVALREQHHAIAQAELERFTRAHPELDGADQQAVNALVNRLVNKLLHTPVVNIKKSAGTPSGDQLVEVARALYELPESGGSSGDGLESSRAPEATPVKATS